MLKEREQILEKLSIVFQVVLTIVCFCLAVWITQVFFKPVNIASIQYEIILLLIALFWTIILGQSNLGRIGRLKMNSILFIEYFTAIIIGNVLIYSSIVILHLDLISRLVLAVFAVTNLIILY